MTHKSIAILSSEFPPGPGGIGNHAESLASYLNSVGNTVFIDSAARSAFPHSAYDKQSPFSISRYSPGRHFIFKLFGSLVYIFFHRGEGCVILSGQMQLLLTLPIQLMTKAKTICIVHGSELGLKNGILKRTLLKALKRADHVVAVSEFTKSRLNAFGFTGTTIVIPNGIRVEESSQPKAKSRDANRNDLVLVTVGSITKRKGQRNVVNALPEIVKMYTNVVYHIIGIPQEGDEIMHLAKELKVEKNIIIHGALSNSDKLQLLERADIFVMLSENLSDGDIEGFGIAILEANILGLPAIGSKNTGIEQAIDQGITGMLVDSNSPRQVVEAIQTILNNYHAFSEKSIQWATRHDWKLIGLQYSNIINS